MSIPSSKKPNPARRRLLGTATGLAAIGFGASVMACSKPAPRVKEPERGLTVFAAASLREAFTSMGREFRATHPELELTFNFAGSQELRTQLEHGARADVFASADQRPMGELFRGALVSKPEVFAWNEPVLVVAKESAGAVQRLEDLPSASRIVVGVPEVPIGRYTLQILDRASEKLGADFRARVESKVVSREMNVRQVLTKVSLGEAQVGVVYRTDVRTAPGPVAVVGIPPDLNVIAEYPIAVVSNPSHPGLARAWMEFVLSEKGQRILQDSGFVTPSKISQSP